MNQIKHALRQLRLRPGLSAVVIVMLALGIGAAIGLAAARALGRVAQALLFGLSGHDPAVIGAAAGVLAAVVAAASWLPAWRASRIAPVEALRYE